MYLSRFRYFGRFTCREHKISITSAKNKITEIVHAIITCGHHIQDLNTIGLRYLLVQILAGTHFSDFFLD